MSESTTNKSWAIGVELRYFLVSLLAGIGASIIGSLIYLLSWSSVYIDGTILPAWAYVSMISGIFVIPIAVCLGYPLSKVFAHKSNIYWLIVSLGLGAGLGFILGLVFSKDLDVSFSVLGLGAVYGGTFGVFMILLRRIPQMCCKREVSYSTQETPEPDESDKLDS